MADMFILRIKTENDFFQNSGSFDGFRVNDQGAMIKVKLVVYWL